MKCFKFYRQHGGQVVRLTNDEAAKAKAAGMGIYAPKSWLRAAKLKEKTPTP
jgi:hypothetical protein|tara:strand:+ start:1132 stop:1287 length:156 start_codon:yes stop_codon:yes gene_type:complete